MKKITQYVLVEPDNCVPYIDKLTVFKGTKIEDIAKYYENEHDFNFEKDGITLIDAPEEIDLTNNKNVL